MAVKHASTHCSSLCCGNVKGFLYGWSLWNHLQFLETSGDMKKAFSTEKERVAEQSGIQMKSLQSWSQLVNKVVECRWGSMCSFKMTCLMKLSILNKVFVNKTELVRLMLWTYCWCTSASAGRRSEAVAHKTVTSCSDVWRRHRLARLPFVTRHGHLRHSTSHPRQRWPGSSLCIWSRLRRAPAAPRLFPRFLSQRARELSCHAAEVPSRTHAPRWIPWLLPTHVHPLTVESCPGEISQFPELSGAGWARCPHGEGNWFYCEWNRTVLAGLLPLLRGGEMMWDWKTPVAALLCALCSV